MIDDFLYKIDFFSHISFLKVIMGHSDKNWSTSLFQKLESLSNDRTSADVTLWSGYRQILAHKLVLDINSSIMTTDDVSFSRTDGKYHVTLSLEFEENFELLCKIITSLYTGMIEIEKDDAKFVYKFAKVYKVDWLKSKAFSIFETMLSEETLLDIFQFSHSICCEELKGLCLDNLTENTVNSLMKSGQLLEVDYFCIQTICDTKAGYIAHLSEMKKFELICRWLETNVEDRICHLESLVSLLEINTLSKSDITSIFDWILQNNHIDEGRRMNLMKEVNAKSKAPIDKCSESYVKNLQTNTLSNRSDRILFKIKKAVLNGANLKISFQEFHSAVDDFYRYGDSLTNHTLTEYFVNNYQMLMTVETITHLIKLNTWGFYILSLIKLGEASSVLCTLIPHIKYKDLQYKNLQIFVGNMRQQTEFLFRLRMVELVMNWAMEHPENPAHVLHLINNLCLCHFPSEYMNLLLKPYILMITSGAIAMYHCPEHGWETVFQKNKAIVTKDKTAGGVEPVYYFGRLTPKNCMMQMETYSFGESYNPSYILRFQGNVLKREIFDLKRIHNYTNGRGRYHSTETFICGDIKLTLFSSNQCMDSYPVLTTCNLRPQKFREIVAKYSDLCWLIFPNYLGDWSKVRN